MECVYYFDFCRLCPDIVVVANNGLLDFWTFGYLDIRSLFVNHQHRLKLSFKVYNALNIERSDDTDPDLNSIVA